MASRVYIEGRSANRDRIARWVKRWRERLHVTDWTFRVCLKRKPHSRDPLHTLAQVNISERYRDATIEAYPRFFEDSQTEQERTIVHEVAHLPINRVANLLDRLIVAGLATKDEVDDAYEGLTEWVTNVVWDAYHRE